MEKTCRTPVIEQVERSMYGSWKPNTSIPVVIKPAEKIYPAPDKVTIIEQPPPPEEPVMEEEEEEEPPMPPTISEPVRIGSASSTLSQDLSESDKAKLRMYLDPYPAETKINGGSGGIMTVEEMNRLWARQSGSIDN